MKKLIKATEKLPPNAVAATLGLCTLSNAYSSLGLTWVRQLCMWFGLLVWLLCVTKIICHFATFKKEYLQPIPGSLYAALPMLTAVLSGYLHDYLPRLGLLVWYVAVIIQGIHILYFTWRNVIKNFTIDGFTPTWFVTYVGILVPVVGGGKFGDPTIMKGLMIYGFLITFTIVPAMLVRLRKKSLPYDLQLTFTIFLAPFSLVTVAYLTMAANPSPWLANGLFLILLGFLVVVLYRLPRFVYRKFTVVFAALTFPLAIATLAAFRMSVFCQQAVPPLQLVYLQLCGILLFITTAVILPVILWFAMSFLEPWRKEHTDN